MGDGVRALTVCCLKVGNKYGSEYVNRLYLGSVAGFGYSERRFTEEPTPFNFVCATEEPDGIDQGVECIPLSDPQLPGWWAKLSLFRPEGAFGQIKGRVLFLDLDVIITGPLDDLVNYPSDFVMMHDFQRPWRPASAVMLLEAGSRPWIWDEFTGSKRLIGPKADWYMAHAHGDQDVIRDVMESQTRWQGPHYGEYCDFFPQRWIRSYKQDCVNGPPPDCRIVAFHGSPKNHEIASGWVKEAWA